MEDMQEQMDLANEIGDAISRPVGDTYDEDELYAELDDIEREELDSKLTDERTASRLPVFVEFVLTIWLTAVPELNALPSPSTQLPAVAVSAKPVAKSAEDSQFDELEGMMN